MILSPEHCDKLRLLVTHEQAMYANGKSIEDLLDTVADLQRQLLEAQGQQALVVAEAVLEVLESLHEGCVNCSQLGGRFCDLAPKIAEVKAQEAALRAGRQE